LRNFALKIIEIWYQIYRENLLIFRFWGQSGLHASLKNLEPLPLASLIFSLSIHIKISLGYHGNKGAKNQKLFTLGLNNPSVIF
jgi:hypothetical protein